MPSAEARAQDSVVLVQMGEPSGRHRAVFAAYANGTSANSGPKNGATSLIAIRKRDRAEWLCAPCNLGIDHFDDNPDRLIAAAEYLRYYEARHAEDIEFKPHYYVPPTVPGSS